MSTGQLPEGTLLNGRYRILRAIGRGGMGTVYKAEHERLEAIVAVKEINGMPVTGTAQQTTLEQYEQEARFLVRLNHPNLPKVTDAFIEGERFYLVMEFIEGVTLETCLKESGGLPLDVNAMVEWGLQIADVLAYLHSQDPPIIFRDLKPSNVMVQPNGHIRLIDFGIARRFQPGAVKDTALLGSVGYSPPEQFGRHQTDTRSDIYAFGATLHHLLTGRDPAATPFKFVAAHVLNPQIPESLSLLLIKCLAMDAENRPPSIHEVAMGLVAVREELAARALNPAPPPAADPPPRIISTKLNEANKGRSGRIPSGKMPSGKMPSGPMPPSAPSNRPVQIALLLAALLIAVGGTAFALYWRSHSQPSASGQGTHAMPPSNLTPPSPLSGGQTSGGTQNPVVPTSGGTAAPGVPTRPDNHALPNPPAAMPSATCNITPALSDDGQTLRLRASGEVKGKKGEKCRVFILFFDGAQPLMAQTPTGPHATPNGYLFGEYPIDCPEDSHSFDGLIEIPRSEIGTPTGALSVQYVVLFGEQRLMDPKVVSLAALFPAPERPQPNTNGGGANSGTLITPPGK